MRPRRYLLLTTALGSGALIGACRKDPVVYDPPPGNPKGSFYDAGHPDVPDDGAETGATATDGGAPTIGVSNNDAGSRTGPVLPRMPANPKGSLYDAGKKPPPTTQ